MTEYAREGGPAFPPAHPGEILREDILPELKKAGVSLAAFARHLRTTRQTVYDIINEKRAVTPDIALRLGAAFGNSPRFWMNLQTNFDLWHAARDREFSEITKLEAGA